MQFDDLLEKANNVYLQNFKPIAWFGRCIFLSWYCDVGDCKFCFRSTQKSRIKNASHAKRSLSSILVEAILCKNLGWNIEFLTGGYRIFPFNELVNIAELVSKAYGKKIWLNIGALDKEQLDAFKPFVKGVVASIETINPELHSKVCPSKPIEPYVDMLNNAKGFKKSIAIVIGLGEKQEDIELLHEFIRKQRLDRITFYALKPIKGTPYTEGPKTEHYVSWIAKTRIAFPKLEIIAGTTARRVEEISLLLKAGANAITKFPATKLFSSEKARIFEEQVKLADRIFTSNLTELPEIDWEEQVDKLVIGSDLKEQTKAKLRQYISKMESKTV